VGKRVEVKRDGSTREGEDVVSGEIEAMCWGLSLWPLEKGWSWAVIFSAFHFLSSSFSFVFFLLLLLLFFVFFFFFRFYSSVLRFLCD
jgi:hypothetical protein